MRFVWANELGYLGTEALQTIGTAWGRSCIRQDLWPSLWLAKADAILADGGRVVQESVPSPDDAHEGRNHQA